MISCSGLGMGNASRVVAIVEALPSDFQCHVVTWGSGYRFFSEYKRETGANFELYRMQDYALKPSVLAYLKAFAKNIFILRRILKRVNPNLLLLDSDYHFPAYIFGRRPIVYVGQAFDILERAQALRYRPNTWRERLSFVFREKLDSWYQRLVSTVVLVPCFGGTGSVARKVRRIPLIVRREFLENRTNFAASFHTGILLSGSEIEKGAFMSLAVRYGLPLLNPVPSKAAKLDRCDVVVIQGGLSSISECIARSKYMVVVPIQDHPEQFLNACQVEQLGLGLRSSLYELSQYPHLMDRVARQRDQTPKSNVDCTGADAAANIILRDVLKMERKALGRETVHPVELLNFGTRPTEGKARGRLVTLEFKAPRERRDQGIVPPQ